MTKGDTRKIENAIIQNVAYLLSLSRILFKNSPCEDDGIFLWILQRKLPHFRRCFLTKYKSLSWNAVVYSNKCCCGRPLRLGPAASPLLLSSPPCKPCLVTLTLRMYFRNFETTVRRSSAHRLYIWRVQFSIPRFALFACPRKIERHTRPLTFKNLT